MKNRNLQFLMFGIFLIIMAGCNNANREKELDLKDKQSQIDSLSIHVQEKSNSQIENKTEKDIPEISEGRLAGKHNLTIQWIGWDKPGEIMFDFIGNDEYEVEGFQKGSKSEECSECYLKVKGRIIEINPKELRFTGKIESSIYYIQGGEPCIKEGTFSFFSTKNRKYWRCQNMEGCDGVIDYVDIYF